MAFSADGRLLALLSGEHGENVSVFEWAATEGEAADGLLVSTTLDAEKVGQMKEISWGEGGASSTSSRKLLATGVDNVVFINWDVEGKMSWDLPIKDTVGTPANIGEYVQSMSLPDSTESITTTLGGYVIVWRPDLESGKVGCGGSFPPSPHRSNLR